MTEQQLASFRAGSREGKARVTVRVEEKKVEEDEKKKKRRKGGGGRDLLLGIHPSPHPSLAAAASAPLPPPSPLLLLDPPSPAGICLLLLLRELLLKRGGGGRSPHPSLPWILGKASGGKKEEGRGGNFRRGHQESRGEATPWFTGEQRRTRKKEGKRPPRHREWTCCCHFTLLFKFFLFFQFSLAL